MSDQLISREALKKAYFKAINETSIGEVSIIDLIDNAPTIPLPDFKEGYKQAIIDGKTNFSRPQGEWIYDELFNNWKCSECGEPPKTIGYVGNADFMKEHFKFCNHCGADMRKGGAE